MNIRIKPKHCYTELPKPWLRYHLIVTPQPEHNAPSTDVEGPLCQMRVITILRTSNLINLYTPNNNFLIQIIIFSKSQTYHNDKKFKLIFLQNSAKPHYKVYVKLLFTCHTKYDKYNISSKFKIYPDKSY